MRRMILLKNNVRLMDHIKNQRYNADIFGEWEREHSPNHVYQPVSLKQNCVTIIQTGFKIDLYTFFHCCGASGMAFKIKVWKTILVKWHWAMNSNYGRGEQDPEVPKASWSQKSIKLFCLLWNQSRATCTGSALRAKKCYYNACAYLWCCPS